MCVLVCVRVCRLIDRNILTVRRMHVVLDEHNAYRFIFFCSLLNLCDETHFGCASAAIQPSNMHEGGSWLTTRHSHRALDPPRAAHDSHSPFATQRAVMHPICEFACHAALIDLLDFSSRKRIDRPVDRHYCRQGL